MKESEGTKDQEKKPSPIPEWGRTRAHAATNPPKYLTPEERRSQGTRSARGRGPLPTHLPTAATCTPRQRELPMDLPPCRRRSQIHVLRFLAEQLGEATNRTATFDTVWLAEWRTFESMLLEARARLDQQLERARGHLLAIQESSLQTSRPL
jgi:hypothetical protein